MGSAIVTYGFGGGLNGYIPTLGFGAGSGPAPPPVGLVVKDTMVFVRPTVDRLVFEGQEVTV